MRTVSLTATAIARRWSRPVSSLMLPTMSASADASRVKRPGCGAEAVAAMSAQDSARSHTSCSRSPRISGSSPSVARYRNARPSSLSAPAASLAWRGLALRGLALKKMRTAMPKSRPRPLQSPVRAQCAWFSVSCRYQVDPWDSPDWLDSIQGEMDGLTGLRKKNGEESGKQNAGDQQAAFILLRLGPGRTASGMRWVQSRHVDAPLHDADPFCTQEIPLHRRAQGDTSAQALIAPLPLLSAASSH